MISHKRYFLILALIFLAEFLLLAISPNYRQDWALENVLVVVFIIVMAIAYFKFPLSRVSYTLIFIFLCLHEIGAHYTYAEVPYDQFFREHFGFSLNAALGWERNNFDRVVHFLYGLLLTYPVREFCIRVINTRGFWAYFFPLLLTMASSMMFELFEWAAAELFGGDLGIAYLGIQGDIWDGHKDMALASLGALTAMLITLVINLHYQKNFAREWDESLTIKDNRPLGEDEIERMQRDQQT